VSRKRLFIVGVSSLAREIESFIDTFDKDNWEIQGFLQLFDGPSPLEGYPSDYSILGGWNTYPLNMEDRCLLAITQFDWKEKVYNGLKSKTNIISYISPHAWVGKFSSIGPGCLITGASRLSCNVKLGKVIFINGGTQIGHDVVIGDYSTIYSQVQIGGKCLIGERVSIGSCAVIMPGIKIGDGATVGTGSVVIKNVKPGVTVFGNPAKSIM